MAAQKPTNITSSDDRALSGVVVPKSGNKDVEREHQNRINKHFDDRIEELEVSGGGTTVVGGGDGNHSTLTADPTNFVLTDSGDRNYHIDIKTGGIGSTELASTAVTAGDYGDDDQSPTFTVDADGRLTSAADVHIPITVYLTAAENLSARDFVSIDSSGDVIQADATSINTAAIGYVKSAFSSSAATKVYLNKGILSGFTGLSIGKKYFLSASTPGGIVLQPTLTGTKVCQFVGTAISSTELSVDIDEAYRLYSNLTVSGTFGNTNVGSPMADSLTITGGVPPYTLLAGWTAPSGSVLEVSGSTVIDTGATDTVNTGQTYSGVVKDSEGAEAPFSGSVDVGTSVAYVTDYVTPLGLYSLTLENDSYAGSCVRVRRSSDSTEQDIGFSGKDIDSSALETFVAGGTGYVVTWYDQSGNGDNLTQASTSRQPKITDGSGNYLGKIALSSASSNAWLKASTLDSPADAAVTVFARGAWGKGGRNTTAPWIQANENAGGKVGFISGYISVASGVGTPGYFMAAFSGFTYTDKRYPASGVDLSADDTDVMLYFDTAAATTPEQQYWYQSGTELAGGVQNSTTNLTGSFNFTTLYVGCGEVSNRGQWCDLTRLVICAGDQQSQRASIEAIP